MQTGQNATPGAGKQSSDVQIRQNSRHAREKKSNEVQTGNEAKSSTGKQYHGVLEGGKRARDTKCSRTDYWCQILPEKKPLTYGKNCGNLIQVGLTCALD